ncbi:hypothetical protein ACFQ68_34170, partial [Amycolatopsis japonica]|uniref:hypothetical protein n=1 Tax=Amycolatopsis japonica TaxID=208439 RepID=UPI00366BB8AE
MDEVLETQVSGVEGLPDVLLEGESGPVVEGSGSALDQDGELGPNEAQETQVSGVKGVWQDEWSVGRWDKFWEDALGWRPRRDGRGPQTFWAYLGLQALPPYIVFEVKNDQPTWASANAELLVRMWAEGLHGEEGATPKWVAELSGGLINIAGVEDVWRVFEQQEILKESPPVVAKREKTWDDEALNKFWDEVPDWRPRPDGTGPQDFWDFLKDQFLPDYVLFKLV